MKGGERAEGIKVPESINVSKDATRGGGGCLGPSQEESIEYWFQEETSLPNGREESGGMQTCRTVPFGPAVFAAP